MKLCLDTNAYSDLRKGRAGYDRLLESAEEIVVPATVVGELEYGFLLGSRCQANEDELEQFLSLPGVRLQSVTRGIAERYAYVKAALRRKGQPIPENDLWIAATALESGCRLLTADAHFSQVAGLIVVGCT